MLRYAMTAFLLSVAVPVSPHLAYGQGGEQAQEHMFDIPPQAISTALARFADTTHVNIAFQTRTAGGVRTQGIKGRYTPQVALSMLLARTGLGVVFTGPRSAVIYPLDAPPPPTAPSYERNVPLITLDMAEVRATRIIGAKPPASSSLDYARRAQLRIKAILATDLDYHSTPYQGRIGITSNQHGRIIDVIFTRSEGKQERDRHIRALLIDRDLDGPPPEGTIQPMWFRISTDDLFGKRTSGE